MITSHKGGCFPLMLDMVMQGSISVHTELDRKELVLGEVIGKVCFRIYHCLSTRDPLVLSTEAPGKAIATWQSKNSPMKYRQVIRWRLLESCLLCA